MPRLLDRLAQSLLFRFDPETAHKIAIRSLSLGLLPGAAQPDASLRTRVLDFDVPTPIGLAAGFDKNAEAVDGLLSLGFGFVEIGTVTPRPQAGNSRPRMFRLEKEEAIINRLGFNNDGADVVRQRLERQSRRGIIGVNIGANRDSEDRVADFVAGIEAFADVAAYLAINVSSPNTPGLRDLQHGDALTDLLLRAVAARDEVTNGARSTPILLKIAPDLGDGELGAIAEAILGAGIDGLIATNTTLTRDNIGRSQHSNESGGLSGRPLFRRSTAMLARLRKLLGPEPVLIGVGGVDSAETAFDKLTAGANLVQIYTGMIYRGQRIAEDVNQGLAQILGREGIASVADAVGTQVDKWANERP